MRRIAVALASVILGGLVALPTAFALASEPEPPFCEESVLRDFLAPLEQMPQLHPPPANGRLGFAPANVTLRTYPALLVKGGEVGFRLSLRRDRPAVHPGWDITTTLSQVDWRGDQTEVVDRSQRRVPALTRENDLAVEFELSGKAAPFRVTAVFRNRAGRRIGGFGFYVRVVPSTRHARLAVNATSFRPGETVLGRIENFGTAPTLIATPFRIDRYDGVGWVPAPESPDGPWLQAASFAVGGTAGPCTAFSIPPGMTPGRYRMVKTIAFGEVQSQDGYQAIREAPSKRFELADEFDVLPAQ